MMKLSRNVSYRETNISGNFHQAVLRFDLQIRKKYNIWSCVLKKAWNSVCGIQNKNSIFLISENLVFINKIFVFLEIKLYNFYYYFGNCYTVQKHWGFKYI